MRRLCKWGGAASVALALFVGPAVWQAAHAQADQDRDIIRRGQGRADLWLYSQENDPSDSHQWKGLLRLQRPFLFPGDWKVTLRTDLPFLYTNKTGPSNPDGNYDLGLGDVLGQITVTTPDLTPHLNLNAGFRIGAPTGGSSPFGASQWKAAPHAGASYDIELSPSVELRLDPLVRYTRGFSTTRAGVTTVRTYDVYPSLTFALPEDWTVGVWNENPMIYNQRSGSWFVPFDMQVTKKLGSGFQFALGAAVRLLGEDKSYKYLLYGRMSIFY